MPRPNHTMNECRCSANTAQYLCHNYFDTMNFRVAITCLMALLFCVLVYKCILRNAFIRRTQTTTRQFVEMPFQGLHSATLVCLSFNMSGSASTSGDKPCQHHLRNITRKNVPELRQCLFMPSPHSQTNQIKLAMVIRQWKRDRVSSCKVNSRKLVKSKIAIVQISCSLSSLH